MFHLLRKLLCFWKSLTLLHCLSTKPYLKYYTPKVVLCVFINGKTVRNPDKLMYISKQPCYPQALQCSSVMARTRVIRRPCSVTTSWPKLCARLIEVGLCNFTSPKQGRRTTASFNAGGSDYVTEMVRNEADYVGYFFVGQSRTVLFVDW